MTVSEKKTYPVLGGWLTVYPEEEITIQDDETGQPKNILMKERIVINVNNRKNKIDVAAIPVLLEVLRANKDLQSSLGVKLGLL